MRKFFIITILVIFTLSCALPMQITLNPRTDQAKVDLALTVTAQALMISELPGEIIQATNTPIPPTSAGDNIAPTSTAVAQSTPTSAFTPIQSTAMVSVSLDTNCRTGPGQAYDIAGALLVGESADVTGKNSSNNNWIIKNPDNPSTTCWLWGKYATITGDQSNIAEISAPPTPIPTPTVTPTKPSPPNPVSNLQGSGSCDDPGGGPSYHLHTVSGTITWKDNANNEQGFNIYADYFGGDPPALLGSSGANATSYAFSALTIDNPFALLVESHNAAGVSKRVSINIPYNCHP
ncbi:MAG: hypothetical protein GY755_10370 [Chloroflexi bacterium]|nr:hypothetical protein [Chloroflexota bacterium]